MKTCDYCGEEKKVKEKIIEDGHYKLYGGLGRVSFSYICEDCDKALEIKYQLEKKEELEKKKKKQKDWIKLRDKLLKNKKEVK